MAAQEYYTILTKAGIQYEADCKAAGKPIKLVKMSIGDGAGSVYNPVDTQTALKRKVWEGPLNGLVKDKVNTAWLVCEAAIPVTVGGWFVREVGVWTDTGVLYAIGKYPETYKPLITTGAGRELYVRAIFTSANADNVTLVIDGTIIQATRAWVKDFVDLELTKIKSDLSGEHPEGGSYNFPLTNFIETDWMLQSSQAECFAEIFRHMGQSGVLGSRQYGRGGTEAFNRAFDNSYAAINLHNHPNLLATAGLGEVSVLINGQYLRTRHNDYRLRQAVAGKYLAMADVPLPPVPASVNAAPTVEAKVVEMRKYFEAFTARDINIRDYRPHFRWTLSVLEIWPELLTGDVSDTFDSFRHHEEVSDYLKLLNRTLMLNAAGHSMSAENGSYIPGSVRQINTKGQPQFVAWRYRISASDVGSIGDYPAEQLLTPLDLPIERWNSNLNAQQLNGTRSARWRINRALSEDPHWGGYTDSATVDLLDELMSKVPGLDGAGSSILERYTDNGLQTQMAEWGKPNVPLNAANYNRRYGSATNASGRSKIIRGYNDPGLFVAANTRPEVAAFTDGAESYRRSYAIPLELILRTPLESWNPYGIQTVASATGDGASAETAYNGRNDSSRHYLTPAEFFAGAVANPDPADTGATPRWVLDGGGVARSVRASGLYSVLPGIEGVGSLRLRFPVYPMYHEGSWAAAQVEALAADYGVNFLHTQRALTDEIDRSAKMERRLQVVEAQLVQQELKKK